MANYTGGNLGDPKTMGIAPVQQAQTQAPVQQANSWQNITDPYALSTVYKMFGGPDYWSAQGYKGNDPTQQQHDYITGDVSEADNSQWLKFLQDKGYGYNYGTDEDNFRYGQLTQNGAPVSGVDTMRWSRPSNDFFNATRAVTLAGLAYGGAMAGGAGGTAGAEGGSAGAGGTEGLSGMDLAADAGAGSGNNIGTAGSVFGGGGTASAGGGSVANTGSDAHFYNNPTAAEGGLGNMGGAGTSQIPSMSLGSSSSSLGQYLKDIGKAFSSPSGQSGNSILAMLGGGGGMTAGDRYRQQLTSQALRDQASQQAPQQMPGWIPGS